MKFNSAILKGQGLWLILLTEHWQPDLQDKYTTSTHFKSSICQQIFLSFGQLQTLFLNN